jgi:hypothetical protein
MSAPVEAPGFSPANPSEQIIGLQPRPAAKAACSEQHQFTGLKPGASTTERELLIQQSIMSLFRVAIPIHSENAKELKLEPQATTRHHVFSPQP